MTCLVLTNVKHNSNCKRRHHGSSEPVIVIVVCLSYLLSGVMSLPSVDDNQSVQNKGTLTKTYTTVKRNSRPGANLEKYFEDFLVKLSLDKLSLELKDEAACKNVATIHYISDRIVWIADKMIKIIEHDDKMVESMQAALHLEDIDSPKLVRARTYPRAKSKIIENSPKDDTSERWHLIKRRSILHALSPPSEPVFSRFGQTNPPNSYPPRIVHRTHSVNWDNTKKMFDESFFKLPEADRKIWLDVSYELFAQKLADSQAPSELRTLKYFLEVGAKAGLTMLNHFYSTPEFVLEAPVIGEIIFKLRQKSQPFYDIIQFVRHLHSYYKLKSAIAVIEQSHEEHDEMRRKMDESKLQIGYSGTALIRRLAQKLIEKWTGKQYEDLRTGREDNFEKEITTRLLYAILSQILGIESRCAPRE